MSIVRQRPRQRVELTPREGQTAESVEADFASSFAFGESLAADGVQAWRSRYRWIGPVKVLAYKEVGPPPWRWPRARIQTRRDIVRFLVGWRSTAFALVLLWAPR